jgi:hypothetical protein
MMKEHLMANILTKYIMGECTSDEIRFIEQWLKSDHSNPILLTLIKQNMTHIEAHVVNESFL